MTLWSVWQGPNLLEPLEQWCCGQIIYLCLVWLRKHLQKVLKETHEDSYWAISYHCTLCGKGFISRNHLKGHMKIHEIDDPYLFALCVKEIYINHPKWHINSHTGQFHKNITVLFNIQNLFVKGWLVLLVQLLSQIFHFGNVISNTKCATHNCLLLVETGKNYCLALTLYNIVF